MSPRLLTSLILLLFPVAAPVFAYDISDRFSVNGVLAGAIQCPDVSAVTRPENSCEPAFPFQPEFSFDPGVNDQFFLKLGFAAGNGLNKKLPFAAAPWAADLEDDVKNINGRDRDYLLTAWYKHTFRLAGDHNLGATIGIIDATDYLLENTYANDEYEQFMNTVMNAVYLLPAYDLGAALQWDHGPWSAHAVVMEVGENDDGNKFNFFGVQAAYRANSRLGTGNFRIVFARDSKQFLDPSRANLENRAGLILSFDQEFGRTFAGWVRIGWQTNDAAISHDALYSGGIDIKGAAWKREKDNIGLAYAYASGGNLNFKKTHVAEAYYRWRVTESLHLTGDLQYQENDFRTGHAPDGWVYSLRAVFGF